MSATRRIRNQTVPLMLLALAACIPASAQAPPFNQCPHVGLSTGCAYLVVVMDGASNVLSDASQPPYDGVDDTLVGVQNSSSNSIASLPLNGSGMAILAFNGSGICAAGIVPAPPGACPFGPTGYEGPGTSFTNVSADQTSGTVTFSPPIPPGGHAYFSLEGFLTATSNPLSISCNPNVGPSQQGAFYSTTCTVTGGPVTSQPGVLATPVYQWSIASGLLPSGLFFSSTTGSTVTLSGNADSLGQYAYSIQVTDNSVPSPQSASQPFAGTVNQLGGQCNNTLSAGSASVGPAGVTSSVLVNSPPGCPLWSASSPVSWITITGGATGSGNGSVLFTVQANGSALARSATLAIAGQSFLVNQLNGCLFGITPLKGSVAASGGGGSISVGVLSSTCAWTAAPDPNSFWLTINGPGIGMGPGTVSYTAAPNLSSIGRTGTIMVAGQTFTVIQAGSTCNFSLARAAQAFPAAGGIGTATVQAPAGCVWPATSSSVPWVTINAIGGSGNGTVSYAVQANPGTAASRTGTFTIAGQTYAVAQAGTSPVICIASVAAPPQVATEGRTEVLGDLLLSCGGILGLTADISLTLNTNVTNAITGVNIADAVLTVNGNNPQNGLVSGYNIIHWPGVFLVPGSHGTTTVVISKVRADASLLGAAANLQSIPVTGQVSVNAVVPVPVTNALETMANAGPALLFQRLPPPPTAFGIVSIPVQYREATPAAFQAGAGAAPATRLRLVLTNVPAGVQVLAPVFPNEGTAQLYSADFNGAGGSPIAGVAQSPLTVTGGVASATWVVLAADPGQFDNYTFPLQLTNAVGVDLSQLQLTASLGPVSDVSVASATAPVPRYRDFSVLQKLVNLRTTSSTLLPPLAFGAPPLAIFSNQLVNDNPNQAATNVVARDRVTAGGNIQGCQATGGANCTVTGNEAVVTYGTLQPGQSVNITLQVGFDPSLPAGTVVESLFSAESDQPNADLSGSSSSAVYVTSGGAVGNPAASLAATPGTPQSTVVGTAFPSPLQVTLKDSAGNPVSGALVLFSAPPSGASAVLSSGSAVTNASGVASVTAMANNILGSYNVTAFYVASTIQTLSATLALTNLPAPPNSDLALGRQATQSSVLPGYATAVAGLAVDGNTDGAFFDGSVTTTNLDSNAWWQVDLGASTAIGSIVVWNRTDCCGSRLNDYWVFVSDTPFLATDTPATLQSRPGTFASHQTTAPNPSTTIAAVTQGRYLRVQLSSPNYLSLAEVQVFAGSNLAQGKTATQSSTLGGYPTAGAGSAVDGNTDGNFPDGSVTATNLEANPWWQVDLGASTPIGSIVVWNRTDCCGSRLNDYWVFVSDTPFLATDTPATLQSRPGTLSFHQTTAPNPFAVIPAPCTGAICPDVILAIQGRYVRVQLSNPNYLSLAEVQVFGPGASPPPGKVATQSSTLPGYPTAVAQSAIDGNPDGNFPDGSVTATNLDTNAWWQVDLGASSTVNSVTIWNRTDCCGSRLNDYWVFVSNTPFLPTDTPANLQFRTGTFSSHQTTAPNPSLTIPVGGQGRFVRVQLTGTNYLSLAEVQVQ